MRRIDCALNGSLTAFLRTGGHVAIASLPTLHVSTLQSSLDGGVSCTPDLFIQKRPLAARKDL